MSYDPNAARKGGARKNLVDAVIKQVERHCKQGAHSADTMGEIIIAVRKYQKDMAK